MTSPTETINHRHMDRLWQRLSETFGSAFTTPYGHKPNQSWIDALKNLTVDEVKKGLDRLFIWESEFPPNALQFRDLCRPVTHQAHEIYKPLPAPTKPFAERQRDAFAALQGMRSKLNHEATSEKRISHLDVQNRDSGCTCPLRENAAGMFVEIDRSCPFCKTLDEIGAGVVETAAVR